MKNIRNRVGQMHIEMGDESYIDTSCERALENSIPPNYLSNMQAPKNEHFEMISYQSSQKVMLFQT